MKEEIKSTLKSMDTEEFIDLAFYRPIGYLCPTGLNNISRTLAFAKHQAANVSSDKTSNSSTDSSNVNALSGLL